jgi:transposase
MYQSRRHRAQNRRLAALIGDFAAGTVGRLTGDQKCPCMMCPGHAAGELRPQSPRRHALERVHQRRHRKVRDARLDHAHKTALRLVRDNQAVYAEDLCVAGLARTRLAKSVADAGWSQLIRCIAEKAAQYGRTFAKVGRFEPTSQVCSACGVKDGPKPLGVRQWACAACGTVHDRDVNAARNILALGRRERLNACGTGVRPPLEVAAGAEAGTRRSAA